MTTEVQQIDQEAAQPASEAPPQVTATYRLVAAFGCKGCGRQTGLAIPQAVEDAKQGKTIGYRCTHCGHLQFMAPHGSPAAAQVNDEKPKIITSPKMNRHDRRVLETLKKRGLVPAGR